MKYRGEIDGLRAIAVISVIFYHCKIPLFSGGFTGVDVFFVISGYLITCLIKEALDKDKFNFVLFYKKRALRLLPAFLITVLCTLLWSQRFYDPDALVRVAKNTYFAMLGFSNLFLAQNTDYFLSDESLNPLVHLWSLSLEEQFYFFWPLSLFLLDSKRLKQKTGAAIALLCFVSLGVSAYCAHTMPGAAYFYLSARLFEFFLGCWLGYSWTKILHYTAPIKERYRNLLALIGFACIGISILGLNGSSTFPGFNALWSCLGTLCVITFARESLVARALCHPVLLYTGLVSYPLYLYHQPIISGLLFMYGEISPFLLLGSVLLGAYPLSFLTYKYIEQPIRKMAITTPARSHLALMTLLGAALLLGMNAYAVSVRYTDAPFATENPYADEVLRQQQISFRDHYQDLMQLSDKKKMRTLFLGDSLMQHYIYPTASSLNLKKADIDLVTLTSCPLLKGVQLLPLTEHSKTCNSLRDKAYNAMQNKSYDVVFISQSWFGYCDTAKDFSGTDCAHRLSNWDKALKETLSFFKTRAQRIVIYGPHPEIMGTNLTRPNIGLKPEGYQQALLRLKIINTEPLSQARAYFKKWENDSTWVLYPQDLIQELHNHEFSYFHDSLHLSKASNDYMTSQIKQTEVFSKLQQVLKAE